MFSTSASESFGKTDLANWMFEKIKVKDEG